MNVVLWFAGLFIGLMLLVGYACCVASGNASRMEEEMRQWTNR